MTRDEIAALLDGATPGLWRWSSDYTTEHDDPTWSLLGDYGYGILVCDGVANSPQGLGDDANARLIAAAPALASAVIAAMDREAALMARAAEYDNAHELQAQTIMMLQATITALRAQAAIAAPDEGMVVHEDGSTGPVTMEYAKDYHVRTAPGWAPSITPDIRDTGETIWRCSMDNWTTGDTVGAESTISGAHAWMLAVEKATKVREHE